MGSLASLPAALGAAIWSLVTSVRFAVVQITVIVSAALVGMIVHQIPAYAIGPNATAADYAREMAKLHAEYDPALGRFVAGLFERVGFFRVFTTPWFTALLALLFVSILACTLDRLPRLWADVRGIRVAQPDAYFDPRLPGRARFEPASAAVAARPWSADAVGGVLRGKRFRVRAESHGDETYVYGDRNQYTKLATLLTHLGLLLFIVAAGVTANGIPFLGLYPAQIPIVLAQDQTQTIQPIGTPNLLVVKNLGFSAPVDAQGRPLDFTTDLAIYQNGVLVARKTIRVNDPLSYAGFTFHQNFTGPALDLNVTDNAGAPLWSGPLALDDPPVQGNAAKRWVVPGRDMVLDLVLLQGGAQAGSQGGAQAGSQGGDVLVMTANRQTGVDSNGQPILQPAFVQVMQPGQKLNVTTDGFTFDFQGVSAYTGLIARSDPGEYLVWFAFGFLLLGLLITFYMPRRRVWLRLSAAGELAVVGRSDRYVAFEREFRSLLVALATVRPAAEPLSEPQDGESAADEGADLTPDLPEPAGFPAVRTR